MEKIKYVKNQYKFKELVESTFDVEDLQNINLDIDIVKRENDQNTKFHRLFYELARQLDFQTVYKNFILNEVKPLYHGERIIFQTIPTFRIAFPNNIAVGEFHKDKLYRDVKWAEKVQEDNFFLPFTDAYDTNTIWVESEEDKGDYAPMNCNYGEFIRWDGSNLCHGNYINKTGNTRVSVDFRVIRESNYLPSETGSINVNVKFAIGGYYSVI
jgi:hypothetical protein